MTPAESVVLKELDSFSEFLRGAEVDTLPPEEWEPKYKELRGISAFFGTKDWDKIEKEVGYEWIRKVREDKTFKKYFKHRRNLDRVMKLL